MRHAEQKLKQVVVWHNKTRKEQDECKHLVKEDVK